VLCLGPEEIRGLIQRGWDPNALDDDGSPALFRAIRAGRTAAAQVLIQCGSAVDTEDRRCDTPLKLAVLNDQPEIVAMLLAAGADPGRRWRHGLTALHVAALAGRRNVAEELTRRLPVDIPDCRRRTALMLAAWQGHASLVAMLVTAGADREARCLVGESACDYAKRSGHLDLAVVLAEGPGSGRQVAVE
jgi:ankyrin repeat protein